MDLLAPQQLEDPSDCAYLDNRTRRCRFFLARDVSASELDGLLAEGWRKFGPYFFQPACGSCRACTPLRVPVSEFTPSRSQKRVWRKGRHLKVSFGPLDFTPRVFELYQAHGQERFGQDDQDLENFLFSFYTPSCPGLQISIHLEETLVAVGWLDRGQISLSSIYFCFDPMHAGLNLGTFSILAELEYARQQGLQWYYLGYFVTGNRSTAYKDRFRPREHYDWIKKQWQSPP